MWPFGVEVTVFLNIFWPFQAGYLFAILFLPQIPFVALSLVSDFA